jgi:hypothetical protein
MRNLFLWSIFNFVFFLNLLCAGTNMSQAERTVDHLIGELEKRLTTKYHLEAVGVSVSMPRGIVKKLGIDFDIEGPLSKGELRKILIHSSKDFIEYVNANQDIQPFLEKRPFKIENVEITLFLMDSSGINIDHPDIGIAGIKQGVLYYRTLIDSDMTPAKTRTEESYEEAVRILREQATDHE